MIPMTPMLRSVLEEAQYGDEPLPVLVGMVEEKNPAAGTTEILAAIHELACAGMLAVTHHENPGTEPSPCPTLAQLLDRYTSGRSAPSGFPATGGQYYLTTSESGRRLLG